TSGRVILHTTVGDIDIELWCREAPRACRNFIQLCLEGYYEDVIFHRVVRNFIVQTGDPTGTGMGGESIYGEPFADEYHSRLRFTRRGLVGMATSTINDNTSQFFITLTATPELQNKHTLFGRVAGNTVFNVLQMNELQLDEERPVKPPKIISAEVVENFFEDIVPRTTS
ncbi:cyclophilin-like domain-containing protein, partial [Syncephalis pseudoplumigaleata]